MTRDVPLGGEIGVHHRASWRIETDSISVVRATACATRLHARVSVSSGDFGIGLVTKGSHRPLDEPSEVGLRLMRSAYTIAQTLSELTAISAIRKRQVKGSRVAPGPIALRAASPRNDLYLPSPDGSSRRKPDAADRGGGRRI